MADRILFIGMQLFQKVVEFYGKLQADGRIESFEPVLLSAHGGDLNGFFLLRGEAEKLGEVQRDETFVDLTIEAGYCLEGVGVIAGVIGEGLTDSFSRWSKLVGD